MGSGELALYKLCGRCAEPLKLEECLLGIISGSRCEKCGTEINVSAYKQRRAFSVAVFVKYGGRVLLVHHKLLAKWLPVGGEIERGERPIEAAAREVKEETGLTRLMFPPAYMRCDGAPSGFLAYEEHDAGPKGLHMNFNFVAVADTDEVTSDGSWFEHAWVDPRAPRSSLPVEAVVPENVVQCLHMIGGVR